MKKIFISLITSFLVGVIAYFYFFNDIVAGIIFGVGTFLICVIIGGDTRGRWRKLP